VSAALREVRRIKLNLLTLELRDYWTTCED